MDIQQLADAHIANTYARFPLALVKGQGCTVWDDQGRAYTDFIAGIAVCNLGHSHPDLVAVLSEQARTLWHVSNLYYTGPQAELAAWLTAHSFADRVFFGNSGAEANEAAIKLARKYFKDQGAPERYRVVSMKQSFHGRTMATLSATGQEKVRKGYDPILEGFDYAAFDDIEDLSCLVGPATCAVMLEPIQGEGGVVVPDKAYLAEVRRLCDETGCLLIFDEIQTGIGRTGKLFAYEHFGVTPDIMTLAKALGNGLPIGAMLATEKVAAAFVPGAHASTFGGTPLVTAVALKVLQILTEEGVLEQAAKTGAYLREALMRLKTKHAAIQEIRGMGLLVAARIDRPAAPIVRACMEQGYLINCVQDNILRFAPPLIVTPEQIDGLMVCLDKVLSGADKQR
ncbi:acetylornithine transaminase [Desulfatitalea alkaliphila]|uniref:Acetylornithine aminotransferase n=1 Tax=Desulfatitalea alkaliphila TaxID=2929485 RepID=A0AA41R6B1_9BACT|nr:acetylornithine transaminase [Desulfatitalea alkaliphila]MCJ8502566.1 acetylornithine transaminase [Desulfatitalea alkaliphila]